MDCIGLAEHLPLICLVVDEPLARLGTLCELDLDRDYSEISRGDLEWCLQTYLILKSRGEVTATCSNSCVPNAINIVHSSQLLRIKGAPNAFVVSVQADYPKRHWAHAHIVQNLSQIGRESHYLPFWIQPGLVPRDSSREEVTTVAYAGQVHRNLAGNVEMWREIFRREGVEFRVLETGKCSDLSSIDVLIGIRSFDHRSHNRKPASKLVNAWAAGIPFVGGNDSAFKQVGTPNVDYLLATTANEVVSAVLRLKNDPKLYADIVQRGRARVGEFSRQAIAARWESLLSGPIYERYLKWRQNGLRERCRFKSLVLLSDVVESIKPLVRSLVRPHT